ncbi:MAG: hypothetical protein JJ859_12965 [Roseicyclus sp.]|nr:hypothetical protein [Roseicyclus sp.]
MIFFETIGTGPESIDSLAVLVHQMRLAGYDAAIAADSIPPGASLYQQYDLAHLITEASPGEGDRLVLIDAHQLNDAALVDLRRRHGDKTQSCLAVGRFETTQSEIGARAKLSYVLGYDPEIDSTAQKRSNGASLDLPVIGVCGNRPNRAARKVPAVLLFDPNIEDPNLKHVATSRQFDVIILTSGKKKQEWIARNGNSVPIYHYGELLPAHISAMADVFVTFHGISSNYRVRSLIANVIAEGAALVDCSEKLEHASESKCFIQGPSDAVGLQSHLKRDIVPNLEAIRATVRHETQGVVAEYARVSAHLADHAHATAAQVAPSAPGSRPQRVVIVPTNGVGLGHAQRTSLIASKLDRDRATPVFAAFPSCIRLINTFGFDAMPLVGRSGHHEQAHANDLVNYLRLHALSREASTLVFDGGYVFDSIYRTVLDHGLNAVWVRRGMWQKRQNNSLPLDREKIFGRVIVPMEAFEELNHVYSSGNHIREVGPIVEPLDFDEPRRESVRAKISEKFEKPFDKLVVTMLGGGVAAKRSVQIQAICGMMEARADVLHLVVVWPTSTVEPTTFAWENTRVVKTHHASVIAAASDLYISAVGYNSFHEALYNAVPTVFIPQTGAFMDDQAARAQAAAERDLAAMVMPQDVMTLRKEIETFLDDGRSREIRERLIDLSLPQPGNRAAASAIEEMVE